MVEGEYLVQSIHMCPCLKTCIPITGLCKGKDLLKVSAVYMAVHVREGTVIAFRLQP